MEQIILTLGVTGVDILTSLLFGILVASMLWCVCYTSKRFDLEIGLYSSMIALVLSASIMAVIAVEEKNASINLSKRATPVVSHENIEKLTSVGTCRYVRDTTLWIIDGVIVRKLVVDGTYTCIPDNKR